MRIAGQVRQHVTQDNRLAQYDTAPMFNILSFSLRVKFLSNVTNGMVFLGAHRQQHIDRIATLMYPGHHVFASFK